MVYVNDDLYTSKFELRNLPAAGVYNRRRGYKRLEYPNTQYPNSPPLPSCCLVPWWLRGPTTSPPFSAPKISRKAAKEQSRKIL